MIIPGDERHPALHHPAKRELPEIIHANGAVSLGFAFANPDKYPCEIDMMVLRRGVPPA